MRTARLRHHVAVLMLVAGCAEPSVTPLDPTPTGGVVSITLTPSGAIVEMGTTRNLLAVARDAAGAPVVTTLTWESSSSTVVTVSVAGVLTPVAPGTASITASRGTVTSEPLPVIVTEASVWPSTGPPSGQLIDAAVARAEITEEQGLIYRVFAAFGDPRLPAPLRGIPSSPMDDPILMRASARYATLSAEAKATLAPFFLSPGSPDSWYAARTNLPTLSAVNSMKHATVRAGESAARADYCEWIRIFYSPRPTAHFNVWVPNGPSETFTTGTAEVLLQEVENVWNVETAAFGRFPLSDANVTGNNGCDGALDIWVMNDFRRTSDTEPDPARGGIAWVTPTTPGCAPSPAFIAFWAPRRLNQNVRQLRNTLAHEFFHVLEVGSYSRNAACISEYDWLGEATGNWAMDLVYPDDQFEHDYAAPYMYIERRVPLDEAANGNAENTNGYSDYPFLLYLSRGYGNSVIKDIWDATESAKSIGAIVKALESRGGIKDIWPEFALSLWNDHEADNQDELFAWDALATGMKEAFDARDAGGSVGDPSTTVDLKDAPRRNFDLLRTAPAQVPAGVGIPRLSIHSDYLKFTDTDAASVIYLNALALADFPHLKIQAMVKQGGVWNAAEDWTKVQFKNFCRDVAAERIEELVLIYSNSDGETDSFPIPFLYKPSVGVSNVGCFKWTGTASVTSAALGETHTGSAATLSFERDRVAPEGGPGFELFTAASGAITGSQTGGCNTLSAFGGIAPLDGSLQINLDNQFFGLEGAPLPDRLIVQATGSTTLSTTSVSCVGPTSVGDAVWDWLIVPDFAGHAVSADGRSIQGNVTETTPIGTRTTAWTLTAVREP